MENKLEPVGIIIIKDGKEHKFIDVVSGKKSTEGLLEYRNNWFNHMKKDLGDNVRFVKIEKCSKCLGAFIFTNEEVEWKKSC